MSRLALLLPLASLLALAPARTASGAEPPAFVVIVHPKNPTGPLGAAAVAAFFLKKSVTWADGAAVRPVDLPAKDPARIAFSEAVLKKSVAATKAYWQQRIFSGRDVPPVERKDDAEVLAFVAGDAGAIGYVSGRAPLDGVRALALLP